MTDRPTATHEIADEDRELAALFYVAATDQPQVEALGEIADALSKIRRTFEAELERASDEAHRAGYAEGLEAAHRSASIVEVDAYLYGRGNR